MNPGPRGDISVEAALASASDAGTPVLLYGGSFDPVHIGHVRLGDGARRQALGADAWLVFVPAARSPHKGSDPGASGPDRVAMLERALADVDRAAVWTDELDRAGANAGDHASAPSYWVDTLERARARAGSGADLRFLIGADQAVAFHRWHRSRDILALARPVVILREPWASVEAFGEAMGELTAPDTDGGESPVWSPAELAFWLSWTLELDVIHASSTAIRAALRRGDPADALDRLDPRVRAYIAERALYAGDGSGSTP